MHAGSAEEDSGSDHDLANESDSSSGVVKSAPPGDKLSYDEDVNLDAPRVAQWEPDEFEVNDSNDESGSDDDMQDELSDLAGPSQVQLVCCLQSS